MKQLFTTVVCAFLGAHLFAQIVIDQNYKPVKGDEFEVHWYNGRPTASNIVQDGEDVNWNLSMLAYTREPFVHKAIGALHARAYPHFLKTQVVMDRGDGYYYYYKYNKTHFSQAGFSRGYRKSVNNVVSSYVYTLKFQDKLFLLGYPFTYGDSLVSTTRYYLPERIKYDDGTTMDTVYGVRTRRSRVVGYGTMTLAGNQSYKVLKVYVTEHSSDTTVMDGDTTILSFSAAWMDFWTEGYAEPLVTAYDIQGNWSVRLLNPNKSSAIVSVRSPLTANMNLYPNPAKTYFNIEDRDIKLARVYDLSSKHVASLSSNDGQFDLEELKKGVYTLAFFDERGAAKGYSKLIVSR